MMATRLPSLPALRLFEAAARHLSFTKAAAELNVTQAAVSHQVRALEDQLGVTLFQRSTRKLTLTAAGQRLAPVATAAFEALTQVVTDIGRGETLLAITTNSSFGSRWLAPRLGRFADRHPEIEITVRHTPAVLDLAREGIDAALRWGRGQWPGLVAESLGPAPILPCCTTEYAERIGLKEPSDIAGARLLHDEAYAEWTQWLQAAGLDPALGRRGLVFDDANALIQATLAGQGIALLTRQTVERELADGRLVAPFALTVSGDYGYYLCYLPEAIKRPKLKAFRDFVLQEAGARGALPTQPNPPLPLFPAARERGRSAQRHKGAPLPKRGG
jgi:LysR family transcriptional regulator, glycine cleavage system transcriptional activator